MDALPRRFADLPAELAQQLRSGRQLVEERDRAEEPWQRVERFPTGLEVLDELLGGGLQRGEMVELVGRRTSGRLSVALSLLASATRQGEAAALVDLGDALDPRDAETAGIDLERLLWVRPGHLKPALAAAEILIGGGFPVVLLDAGVPPVPGGRGVEASWLRLQRAAAAHDAALLVVTPYRMTGTAAQGVLEMRAVEGLWDARAATFPGPRRSRPTARPPQLLLGARSEVVLEKGRGRRLGLGRGRSADLELRLRPDSLARPLLLDSASDSASDVAPDPALDSSIHDAREPVSGSTSADRAGLASSRRTGTEHGPKRGPKRGPGRGPRTLDAVAGDVLRRFEEREPDRRTAKRESKRESGENREREPPLDAEAGPHEQTVEPPVESPAEPPVELPPLREAAR